MVIRRPFVSKYILIPPCFDAFTRNLDMKKCFRRNTWNTQPDQPSDSCSPCAKHFLTATNLKLYFNYKCLIKIFQAPSKKFCPPNPTNFCARFWATCEKGAYCSRLENARGRAKRKIKISQKRTCILRACVLLYWSADESVVCAGSSVG